VRSPYFLSFLIHFVIILILALWPAAKKPLLPPSQTIQIRFRASSPPPQAQTEAPVIPKIKKTPEKPIPPGPKLVEKIRKQKKLTKPEPPKQEKKAESQPNAIQTPSHTPFGEAVLENPNFPYSYYIEQMLNKIDQAWENPVRSDLPLSTVIYFRIQKDGRLTDLNIEAPSGISQFDNACKRALLSSDPFAPLPADFIDSYLGIHLEFKQ